MRYLCTVSGVVLTRSVSKLGGEYSFNYNRIWCGGVGVTGLALRLLLGVGDAGMDTSCRSTLRCG